MNLNTFYISFYILEFLSSKFAVFSNSVLLANFIKVPILITLQYISKYIYIYNTDKIMHYFWCTIRRISAPCLYPVADVLSFTVQSRADFTVCI